MPRSKGVYKDPNSMRGRARIIDPEYYRRPPTQERLKYLFMYREDGEFVRKVLASPLSRAKVGEVVKGGVCTKGYKQIYVDGIDYLLHRLVFLYHHGYMPENQIDHIDQDRSNNRIDNLREVSQSCNLRNMGTHRCNAVGVKGVTYRKSQSRYVAGIRINGILTHLIQTTDLIEAVCYRYAAEQCVGWNTCDANSPAYKFLREKGVIKCD